MRRAIDPQMKIGAVDISQIKFDLRSRDEIPKLLMGLQYIYCNVDIREEIFKILEDVVPKGINQNNGRPGMELWKILVLGTIRLNCNWDFDKLQEIANNHKSLREMLGHRGIWDDDYKYALQTLKDNVSLLTPEVLDRINEIVVKSGHNLVVKNKDEKLRGRCDSFVVETDVHFPTDINLLFDAIRRAIILIAVLCQSLNITLWRQSRHSLRKIKKLFRKVQTLKHSTSKDEKKKAERERLIKEAYQAYIDLVNGFLARIKVTVKLLLDKELIIEEMFIKIEEYIVHAERQIDQIQRRVMNGESIPHSEKVFSIFEEHTEWISKGKAGVPQELGVKVCILEDQYGFIMHHHVMQGQTDDQVAVPMVIAAKEKFPELSICSFDKGYYSPSNLQELTRILEIVVLCKKGKLSLDQAELESSKAFIEYRHQHSAVESAINALENHSLDRCPDHGIDGFKRYVSLAVLGRNIQILGNLIQKRNANKQKRIDGLHARMMFYRISRAG
jgi:hypothetical protein